MTDEDDKQRKLERLQCLLDVYGGDRDRWPLRERLGVAEFVAEDQEAQQLVREARLLDRMIEGSPLQAPPRRTQSRELNHLSSRILAEARADNRHAARDKERSLMVPFGRRPVQSRILQAAGLLAACLVIGIMVGRSGVLFTDAEQVAQATSMEDPLAFLPDDGLILFAEEDMI